MNCLSTSSLIMTEDGLKRIMEVKEGDQIYAFDQKTYQLVLKKCTGVFDNGIKDVYELTTLHHSIKATANHPFLVLKRNGRGKENNFVWKTISEMKPGDEIVVLKNLDKGKSFKFDFNKVKRGDYKVNRLNEIDLPEYSSPDLMKYLGIYVGDGWVRDGKGEVGFALPENSKGRNVLLELHSKIFGGKTRTNKIYVYTNSVNLARFIESLGFGSGAKNKIIPSWLFTLPIEERKSFIEGLMLSDGYKAGNSLRYVSASYELLRGLRLLLQTTGFRVGKVHQQRKEKGTKCVDRELLETSEYGYVCFSERGEWNTGKYPSQYRYQNFLMDNEYFEMKEVREIKLVGQEPTLDLRVEGEHNFIADGIVVHNTGIQRSSASPRGAATTTSPAGRAIPEGKQEYRKDLTQIMAAHNSPYVAQASPGYYNDLMKKVQKALSVEGPTFINILSPCPRGWRYDPSRTIEIAKLAVLTGFWPLYEVENGKYRITYKPKKKRKPFVEWLKSQGRFKHLLKEENREIVEQLGKRAEEKEKALYALAGEEFS
ncbi:MAG: LAGLIDADG family homing endonuclease [Candidatus Aerophobetes bacterium]|nr:LAGLIDADG family homing endonuclease [Candidatus Aerophobetes bacterium]